MTIALQKALLGHCLLDPGRLYELQALASPLNFIGIQRRLYQAMLKLQENNEASEGDLLDIFRLEQVVNESVNGDDHISLGEIVDLIDPGWIFPGVWNMLLKSFRREITQNALGKTLNKAVGQVVEGSAGLLEICDSVQTGLSEIRQKFSPPALKPLSTTLNQALSKYVDAHKQTPNSGTLSDYRAVDDFTCGFERGELGILAAETGVGKSSLALGIARNICRRGGKCAFFSLEMSNTGLIDRLLSPLAQVPVFAIRSGLSNLELERLKEASLLVSGWKLFFYDASAISIPDIKTLVSQINREVPVDLVVIDYLQLATTGFREENRFQEVSRVARELKNLAMLLAVPVLALSQVSREAKKADRLGLHHLRESGELEQAADIVLLLNRFKNKQEVVYELDVAKNRNGPTGSTPLTFNSSTLCFFDA